MEAKYLYLSPYRETFDCRGNPEYCRYPLNSPSSKAYFVWKNVNFVNGYTHPYKYIDIVNWTAKKAMEDLDRCLIDRGFILLTEDQWNKYSLLI